MMMMNGDGDGDHNGDDSGDDDYDILFLLLTSTSPILCFYRWLLWQEM